MTMMEMMWMKGAVRSARTKAVVLLERIDAGLEDSLFCFLSPGKEDLSGGKVRTHIVW
jgi:hypothetical protein